MRNPFRKQLPVYSPISLRDIVTAAARALLGRWTRPRDALAGVLRERYDADAVTLFDSGTHALTAAIELARGGDPDAPVALPAFTCYDVGTAGVAAGGPLLLYDLDPDTLGPDPTSLRTALEQGARVVVVAPLYGLPVAWDRMEPMTREHGATLVEDAAQAAGGSWGGRPLGSLAGISVLSFGRGKGWTGGGGGALLVRGRRSRPVPEPRPASTARQLMSLLTTTAQWLLGRPAIYGLPAAVPWLHLGETRYKPPSPGWGMGAFNAALALATREASEGAGATRREVARGLRSALERDPRLRLPGPPEGGAGGWLRLPCRVPDPEVRRRLVATGGRAGVERSYPSTLAALAAVRERLAAIAPTPGSDALARELVTLPTHSLVGAAEIDGLPRIAAASSFPAPSPTAAVGHPTL